jgi:hypothetical protein
MTANMKIRAICNIAPCSFVEVDVSEVRTASIIRVVNDVYHQGGER